MRLFEFWNISDQALANLYGAFWQGQTFTPRESHTAKLLKLIMYRYGLPGTLGISLRAVGDDCKPTGDDLAYVELDANQLPTVYGEAKLGVSLGDGISLDKDTTYAIVTRAESGDSNNYIRWRFQQPSLYPRGLHVFSSDSGQNWELDPTRDMRFEEWGE